MQIHEIFSYRIIDNYLIFLLSPYIISQEEAEDQEHHQQNVEDHLQVEMADWGEEEEEEENVDQQTNDSYETSETSADIKPVLQQPNFGELIAEAVDYLPPSLKISSVKKTNKVNILCQKKEVFTNHNKFNVYFAGYSFDCGQPR